MYKIPRDPNWCSYCKTKEQVPPWYKVEEACKHHGKEKNEYNGPDAYDPSEWVLEVVGSRFTSLDGPVICTGYDPRHGFWVKNESTGIERNISERAIGRTFHKIY